MSVYTTLSLEQVQAFAAPFALQVIGLSPIQGGIQNTNYFLHCHDHQDYVLTLFEDMDATQAGEIVPALDRLAKAGLPIAMPLKLNGQAIHTLADKPAQIAPRLKGQHPKVATVGQVAALAQAQAQLHLSLADLKLQREFNRNHQYWRQVAGVQLESMSEPDAALLQQVIALLDRSRALYPERACGWIHSDLFRDNTLFEADQLTGILDFYELNYDEFLFDLAISINDFCCSSAPVMIDLDKQAAFLTAYQRIRQLSQDELACLNVYLAVAAARFWLLRLGVVQRNQMQARGGDDILIKNPLEMRDLLVKRLAAVSL